MQRNPTLKATMTTGTTASTNNDILISNSNNKFADNIHANMPSRISLRYFEDTLHKKENEL
jgi:hypothetical protein